MKNNIIIGINLGDFGSTGNIMRNSLEYASLHGDFDYLVIVPKSNNRSNTFTYFDKNNFIDKIDRRFFHRTIGNPDGFFEYRATKRIINKISCVSKHYKNTIIHLHNIHMAAIDLRFLFSFLSRTKCIKNIFYTIHDSWPYTGGCYFYSHINCNKWKNGCVGFCAQNYGNYDISHLWGLKRKYTLLLKGKMTLLPVSNWINKEINDSFLHDFNRIVIYGETNIQNLGYKDEKLVNKYNLRGKKIILTIAAFWDPWKGANYVCEVGRLLPEDYVIIVIGKSFNHKLDKNIIHIDYVSTEELSHFYSIADVYMSTSQSESLGLTTCEAQICGIPVVAFGHTAVKETITPKTGIIVGEDNDTQKMVEAIKKVIKEKPFDKNEIIKNGFRFSKYMCAKAYFELYVKAISS